MVRNMILLVHDCCMWPRTHPGCPVIHQNVSRVLGKALKIFATIVTLTSLESDKPWPGSPFSVIWFKTTGPVWNIKEDKG